MQRSAPDRLQTFAGKNRKQNKKKKVRGKSDNSSEVSNMSPGMQSALSSCVAMQCGEEQCEIDHSADVAENLAQGSVANQNVEQDLARCHIKVGSGEEDLHKTEPGNMLVLLEGR